MDMSFSTRSALFSNTNNTHNQSSYSAYFQNKIDENESATATRKPRNTSSVTVSSYTDKNGNVHKTFTGQSTDVVETMKKYAEKNKDKDKVKVKKHLQYSYQKVSNQVLMAKNSMSASKAVLSATRSLAELKRKIKSSDCSQDEKEAALAHANQMLRIAKKKKHNLEMEELVKVSLKEDGSGFERPEFIEDDKPERKPFDISQLYMDSDGNPDSEANESFALEDESINFAELLNSDAEDIEGLEDIKDIEDIEELIDDLSEDMSDMIDETFKDLMDLLDIINPHMDEEHFEKLKMKHRQDEQKQLVKADTEYLKAYLKAIQEEGAAAPSSNNSMDMSAFNMVLADAVMTAPAETETTSIGFSIGV